MGGFFAVKTKKCCRLHDFVINIQKKQVKPMKNGNKAKFTRVLFCDILFGLGIGQWPKSIIINHFWL